jgi:hypothetical protein
MWHHNYFIFHIQSKSIMLQSLIKKIQIHLHQTSTVNFKALLLTEVYSQPKIHSLSQTQKLAQGYNYNPIPYFPITQFIYFSQSPYKDHCSSYLKVATRIFNSISFHSSLPVSIISNIVVLEKMHSKTLCFFIMSTNCPF